MVTEPVGIPVRLPLRQLLDQGLTLRHGVAQRLRNPLELEGLPGTVLPVFEPDRRVAAGPQPAAELRLNEPVEAPDVVVQDPAVHGRPPPVCPLGAVEDPHVDVEVGVGWAGRAPDGPPSGG